MGAVVAEIVLDIGLGPFVLGLGCIYERHHIIIECII